MLETLNVIDHSADASDADMVATITAAAAASTLTTVERLSRDVGRKIRAAEARLDSAGIAVAELMIDYLRSEREARLHPSHGQVAVGKMVQALASWHQFRTLTVESHESLYDDVAGKLGTQVIAGGDLIRNPDKEG